MDESTKAEEWRIERAKRMNSNAVKETRDATPTKKPRSDKGKHHHVAGVLQEDVDEAEN